MKQTIAASLLVLAATACNKAAPVENKPAAAPVTAPPPAPVAETVNSAAPAPTAEVPAVKDAEQSAGTGDGEPGGPQEEADITPNPRDEDEAPARGCAREIGAERAQRLVRQCLMVSTASHPPCNVENSCALIRSEIERGCGIAGEDAPRFCR